MKNGDIPMELRIIADGLAFPEGPVVLPDGDVLVVELLSGCLTRIAPDGRKTVAAHTGGGPNGAAMGLDGRCFICNNGGMGPSASPDVLIPTEAPLETRPGYIQAVDLDTGRVETIFAHSKATPFWGPNDLVFDGAGGFWFTDYGRDRHRVRQRGAVYYAQADGSAITEAIFPLDSPNGIGLSPDGKTLYVAETMSGHLWRFCLSSAGIIDRSQGQFPNGGTIIGRAAAGKFLDSLAVDSAGAICCASPGHGDILVFPPEGGYPEIIGMPDFLTTNIAFGGADLTTAYITLGSSGRLAAMDWPRPGLRLKGKEAVLF
jgi:gluconolactonase